MVLFGEMDVSLSATFIYNNVISLWDRQISPPGQKGGGGTSSNMHFDLQSAVIDVPKSWMTNNIITDVK